MPRFDDSPAASRSFARSAKPGGTPERGHPLINAYETEAEALELLGEAIEKHGDLAVEHLMLIEDDPEADTFRRIGIGSELLAYVRNAA